MHKVCLPIMLAAALWAIPCPTRAAEPATPDTGAPKGAPAAQTPAAKPAPVDPATAAAEARYRAWVDKEHAADAAAFAKEKTKIEDKYKGYVRPKHDKKKDAKAEPAAPKGN